MSIRSPAKTHDECLCAPAGELRAGIPPGRSVAERLRSRISAGLEASVDALFTWQQRRADRLRLQRMDDHMLKDMGLSRADIEAEIHKPFWRP